MGFGIKPRAKCHNLITIFLSVINFLYLESTQISMAFPDVHPHIINLINGQFPDGYNSGVKCDLHMCFMICLCFTRS